jgi:hypothetical protein
MAHRAPGDIKAKARGISHGFGGEEQIEDSNVISAQRMIAAFSLRPG